MTAPRALDERVRLDVWPLQLDLEEHALDQLRGTLDEGELKRAASMRSPRSAARFLAGRGQLRRVLGTLLDRDPSALRFTYGRFGKPSLEAESRVRFNLSHSEGQALLVVAEHAELGFDVEVNRTRERSEKIAHRFFAPAEYDALLALAPHEREAAFLRCWTRKEAYLKALGGGLRIPLNGFVVSFDAGEPPCLRWAEQAGELWRWTLIDLSYACADATAAACVEGSAAHVRVHELAK